MKIIAGSSNLPLAQGIAKLFGTELVNVELSYFANGEKRVWVKEAVRGQNVAVIQSLSAPVDEHAMELLLLIDALERLGTRDINVVIPWMGYSLQDKVFREGEPIAAKVIADLISKSYVKRAFLLDLHNSSTPGFFSIPTEHLSATSLFVDYVKKTFEMSKVVVASPDFGGLKRSRVFAESLNVELVKIDKHRNLNSGEVSAMDVSGDVNGKIVVVFDDVINSGSTVVSAAQLLKERGAAEVHFAAVHGLFADKGLQRIQDSQVDTVIVTNSIPQPPSGTSPDVYSKIHYLDSSQLFVEALHPWLE